MVRMIKEASKSNVTAAVGDGGNDISMIQGLKFVKLNSQEIKQLQLNQPVCRGTCRDWHLWSWGSCCCQSGRFFSVTIQTLAESLSNPWALVLQQTGIFCPVLILQAGLTIRTDQDLEIIWSDLTFIGILFADYMLYLPAIVCHLL